LETMAWHRNRRSLRVKAMLRFTPKSGMLHCKQDHKSGYAQGAFYE